MVGSNGTRRTRGHEVSYHQQSFMRAADAGR
jgi:hypothetical protein